MDYNESKAIGELGNEKRETQKKKLSYADVKEYNLTPTRYAALILAHRCFPLEYEILGDKRHSQLHDSQCPQDKSPVFRRNSYSWNED